MNRTAVFLLALGCAGVFGSRAGACWAAVDPRELARDAPIIVTGTIVQIDEWVPGGGPQCDVAHIAIEAVHKTKAATSPVSPVPAPGPEDAP
jgi:hypothetical protein